MIVASLTSDEKNEVKAALFTVEEGGPIVARTNFESGCSRIRFSMVETIRSVSARLVPSGILIFRIAMP